MTMTEQDIGERSLLMTRPVRLCFLRYYALMIIFLILAIYLQFFRSPWFPEYLVLDKWSVYTLLEILLIFISLILFLTAESKRALRLYLVTNIRVVDTYGLFRKSTEVMMVNKIERVFTTQSFLQRLFKFGDVVVDTGEDHVVLGGVRNPVKVEGAITNALAAYKTNR